MNKLQWKLNRNLNIFIQENALENVVGEMAAIFPGGDELTAVVSGREVLWHIHEINPTVRGQTTILYNEIQNYRSASTSPRVQWVHWLQVNVLNL